MMPWQAFPYSPFNLTSLPHSQVRTSAGITPHAMQTTDTCLQTSDLANFGCVPECVFHNAVGTCEADRHHKRFWQSGGNQ